jgi:acyl-CoA thioesterase-2
VHDDTGNLPPTFTTLFALTGSSTGSLRAPAVPETDEPLLFGGISIGQAIIAVSREAACCHALQTHFVRAGKSEEPFDITVESTRDGGSFTLRRFEIRQSSELLSVGYSSHNKGDHGPDYQSKMPDLPSPERLEDQRDLRAHRAASAGKVCRRYLAEEMLDIRPIELPSAQGEGHRAIWFRPRTPIDGADVLHRAAIGFASDVGLIHVGLQTHALHGGGVLQTASLNHAIWFHRPTSANDWLLHVQNSGTIAQGRHSDRRRWRPWARSCPVARSARR